MRKIIVHMATSADGYIARPDGDFAWLDRPRPKGNYGMGAFVRSVDTVVWGRKTYDMGVAFGQPGFPGKVNYVFSRRPAPAAALGVEFERGTVRAFARRLRRQPGKDIWIMGGAEIVAAFLNVGEVDLFDIHVVPILIGEGIPLVAPRHRTIRLRLVHTRRFADGVVQLRYAVLRSRHRRTLRRGNIVQGSRA